MANVGGPNNNQPQPDLQAFKDAADGARDNTQIKVDRNTGNVGTRSFLGRAWRAVTPQNFGRRESNRSGIESFRMALLNQNNNLFLSKNDKQSDVENVLDVVLPGHQNGNVPLTAGAVRHSIKYVDMLNNFEYRNMLEYRNMQKMPIEAAVDNSQFQNFCVKEYATDSLNFYLEARDILGDGNNIIDAKKFKELFDLYISVGGDQEINITGALRENMTQFAANNNVKHYNDQQSQNARQLLQEAQVQIRKLMREGPLTNFQAALRNQLNKR